MVFQEVVHSAPTEEAEVAKLQCSTEGRMDADKNAPLTAKGRKAMVRSVIDGGHSRAAVASQFNVAPKILAKWVARFRTKGRWLARSFDKDHLAGFRVPSQRRCAAR